ncbi:germination protein YpeB [Paenibacillus sp. FJAT-26967]|uniref:germination protein YpeB n=1 Tax=Paenibacillus sp. FJAT-26967 TaxID=1729690 RepID=UPI0008394D4B|nr:germination protein YpeB [Paenibacillus sp. FJAT-26967]
MYRKLSMVLFPLSTLALVGTAVWGYNQQQQKNEVMVRGENQYQRAFHDLSFHVEKLHTELGNTLALNSTSSDSYRKGLVNVWRLTSEAQSEVNQLPLALLPFNKTEEFLSKVAKFSYQTSVRDLTQKPLTDGEVKTLSTLYQHSKDITKDLRGVQDKVIANNLRWMDVQTALGHNTEPNDNTIIDGFKTVDKKVGEYNDLKEGPFTMSTQAKYSAKMLDGNDISEQEVRQKAAAFLGVNNPAVFQVVKNGNGGSEYESYTCTLPGGKNGTDLSMDFTKKGGQLIYYLNPRDVKSAKLNVEQSRAAAEQFLERHGYKNMTAVSFDRHQNICNMTFARQDQDTVVYPEKLVVNVALDDGQIIGLQGTDYVFANRKHPLLGQEPKISVEEARKHLSPKLKVTRQTKALIMNDMNEEVLCHEFIGTMNGQIYRIYVNGDNGVEEKVETIRQEDIQEAK